MTVPSPAARVAEPQNGTPARLAGSLLWLKAVAQSTRPRQWPKNLLVFAAPLAGDSFGRAFGFWYALVAAFAFIAGSSAVGLVIGEFLLTAAVAAYLVVSFLYSAGLKHVPVVELGCVASGFVLRVVGGAAATHVPPSGWFLLVCSLGALMVAIAKRYTEFTVLGSDAAAHRPAMHGYSLRALRLAQRAVSVIMVGSYALWAVGEPASAMRIWHL